MQRNRVIFSRFVHCLLLMIMTIPLLSSCEREENTSTENIIDTTAPVTDSNILTAVYPSTSTT